MKPSWIFNPGTARIPSFLAAFGCLGIGGWRRERDSQYIFNILLFPKKQKIVFYKYRAKYRQVSSAAPAVLRTIGTV
jgi:hypothetical protein